MGGEGAGGLPAPSHSRPFQVRGLFSAKPKVQGLFSAKPELEKGRAKTTFGKKSRGFRDEVELTRKLAQTLVEHMKNRETS